MASTLQKTPEHVTGKTVIIGASSNPSRYAYMAAQLLQQRGIPFVPIGIRSGEVAGQPILLLTDRPVIEDVDTVTLYLSAANQQEWEDYILSLHPRRILFNPGAENALFSAKAQAAGILVENACTLVLLQLGEW